MVELHKADAIAFVIDGERVMDARKRSEVFASARSIIRALNETGTIKRGSQIQLVTTKYDLLDGDGQDAAEALEALTVFEDQIVAAFGERYQVRAFRTAARDPSGQIEPATGVAPLFRSWLERSPLPILNETKLPHLTG